MIRIEELISEQRIKMDGEWNGGFKYGHDFNILKSIIKYHTDNVLIASLVEDFRDESLKNKVKLWMAGL